MSKGYSGLYEGTKGGSGGNGNSSSGSSIKESAANIAQSLPKNPEKLLEKGWHETTHPGMKENTDSRTFSDPKTGLNIRFDKGESGETGFRGKDHYHIENPNRTGKQDFYLDKDGNPVPKGSDKSHILPKE
jgi:hypothetical protein